MGKKEVENVILRALRTNSRLSLSELSRRENIPLQTMLAAFRNIERRMVLRYASLLEPREMGYSLKVNFLLKARDDEARGFLERHQSINNCSRLMDEGLFYIECFFRDMKDLHEFRESLAESGARVIDEAFVTEELKREGFMGS